MKGMLPIAAVALLAVTHAEAKSKDWTFHLGRDENVLRVTVKPVANRGFALDVYRVGEKSPQTIRVGYPDRGPMKGGKLIDWEEDIGYSEGMQRQRRHLPMPKANVYSNAYVDVSAKGWYNFGYSMLPFFMPYSGLYRHKRVAADIGNWLREYPLFPEREFAFEFRYDAALDRLEGSLDGSYAGKAKGSGALAKVVVRADERAVVEGKGRKEAITTSRRLPALVGRANPLLRKDARLRFAPQFEKRIAASMDVWEPSRSVDQGRHRSTGAVRELCADPQSQRTPWRTGPEFMQWTVPTAFYGWATVLCADLPEKGKTPKIGFSMTRFGTANVGSLAQAFISLEGAETNGNIRAVGKLEYKDADGRKAETTLYLARVKLNPFQILQYINDLHVYGKEGNGRLLRMMWDVNDYLDVEFVGAGTWEGYPRSSVQIFGCTLEQTDYSAVMDQSVRGNLFERGTDKPETGVKVTAETDNASGIIQYRIFDPLFRELARGEKPFTIAKKGQTQRLSFDLNTLTDAARGTTYEAPNGWYGVDFTFCDARGRALGVHEASYTILAADDREAGCESPYAAWPLGDGYHNSDPNRRQQAEVMRKAGYRGSWQPPVERENEFGFPLTRTNVGLGYCNPGSRRSAEELKKHLDRTVEHIREERRKFPSCRFIQLLHEQGGRDVDACLYDPKKSHERGEYKGIDGDWDVYFCTEYAKRMRQEFPDMKIFIGNGSVSSEKVADLVRRGFDLSLVDQLGIESKGFSTLPELSCHREAPGCLWALKETGRIFGYTHLSMNACNEYVFRPERRVDRKGSPTRILRQTNYVVRDYLLSLAHGCGIISSGHLEDCNDAYYDTNWGCGGQCTFYPFSYPKRMFTALSVFTRVMDKATLSRVIPTGGSATYVLEFGRDRKVRDYAYALWTQERTVYLKATFPAGAKVRAIDLWGVERPVESVCEVAASGSPTYLVSDRPVDSVVLNPPTFKLGKRYRPIIAPGWSGFVREESRKIHWGLFTTAYGTPAMPAGEWKISEVNDAEIGRALSMELVRTEPAPSPLLWEAGNLRFERPIMVNAGAKMAVLIKGNGGCGAVALGYYSPERRGPAYCFGKTYVNFDGWQMIEMTAPRSHLSKPITKVEVQGLLFGTGRKALNPIEMADVTGDLRFGGIYMVDDSVAESEEMSDADRRGSDVMKRDVQDKDL